MMQILEDYPDEVYRDVRQAYGEKLTVEIWNQAVDRACSIGERWHNRRNQQRNRAERVPDLKTYTGFARIFVYAKKIDLLSLSIDYMLLIQDEQMGMLEAVKHVMQDSDSQKFVEQIIKTVRQKITKSREITKDYIVKLNTETDNMLKDLHQA